MRKLIVAAAGAGKSTDLTKLAMNYSDQDKCVLLLSYTENNQQELVRKFCESNRCQPRHVTVKGWFTFLLEDMIRPYQRFIFSERIPGIFFNSAGDPHKRNGYTIPGRKEKLSCGSYNPDYFLTKGDHLAHTTYLSKLASRIHKASSGKIVQRLSTIYHAVFIDEVQDLVGWDFDIIDALAVGFSGDLCCVGDFRQTIYRTSCAAKKPQLISGKLDRLKAAGFESTDKNVSHRCIQSICDLADRVHTGAFNFPATVSQVDTIPAKIQNHLGVFVVARNDMETYCARFSPVILRRNRTIEANLCDGWSVYNYGEAKGLGFDRVLVLPTSKHEKFLAGNLSVFDGAKTDEGRNKFYVAITRARYSLAFAYDGQIGLSGVSQWPPSST